MKYANRVLGGLLLALLPALALAQDHRRRPPPPMPADAAADGAARRLWCGRPSPTRRRIWRPTNRM